jgi:hypothetical protein
MVRSQEGEKPFQPTGWHGGECHRPAGASGNWLAGLLGRKTVTKATQLDCAFIQGTGATSD